MGSANLTRRYLIPQLVFLTPGPQVPRRWNEFGHHPEVRCRELVTSHGTNTRHLNYSIDSLMDKQ